MLRASQQFEGYDLKRVPAHDRREQFVFEPDLENYEDNDFEQDVPEEKARMIELAEGNHPVTMPRRPRQNDEMEDSTTINIFMETLSSKSLPQIEDVIHHQSDNSVKPIIGNKEI